MRWQQLSSRPTALLQKGTEPLPIFQEQSVNVSLECQKWRSPSIRAQHCYLWHDNHNRGPSAEPLRSWRIFRGTNWPPFCMSYLAWFHIYSVILSPTLISFQTNWFFSLSTISFVSPSFFIHCNQFSSVNIQKQSPSKHFNCLSTPITRQTPTEILPIDPLNVMMCSAAWLLGTDPHWFWHAVMYYSFSDEHI